MHSYSQKALTGLLLLLLFSAALQCQELTPDATKPRFDSWATFSLGIATGGVSSFFGYQIGNRIFIQPSWQATSFGWIFEDFTLSAHSLALGITSGNDTGRLSFAIGPSYMKGVHITYKTFFTNYKKETVYEGAGFILDAQAFLTSKSGLGLGLNFFGNIAPKHYNAGVRLILAFDGNPPKKKE